MPVCQRGLALPFAFAVEDIVHDSGLAGQGAPPAAPRPAAGLRRLRELAVGAVLAGALAILAGCSGISEVFNRDSSARHAGTTGAIE